MSEEEDQTRRVRSREEERRRGVVEVGWKETDWTDSSCPRRRAERVTGWRIVEVVIVRRAWSPKRASTSCSWSSVMSVSTSPNPPSERSEHDD